MSTSGRSFTYPQIEGTLLERVLHNLRLHDTEYNHLTPTALLAELDAAIEVERKVTALRADLRETWSAVECRPKDPPLVGGSDLFLEVILRSISQETNLDYVHKRALEGLRALGKER